LTKRKPLSKVLGVSQVSSILVFLKKTIARAPSMTATVFRVIKAKAIE
jgi:hypothetical protein